MFRCVPTILKRDAELKVMACGSSVLATGWVGTNGRNSSARTCTGRPVARTRSGRAGKTWQGRQARPGQAAAGRWPCLEQRGLVALLQQDLVFLGVVDGAEQGVELHNQAAGQGRGGQRRGGGTAEPRARGALLAEPRAPAPLQTTEQCPSTQGVERGTGPEPGGIAVQCSRTRCHTPANHADRHHCAVHAVHMCSAQCPLTASRPAGRRGGSRGPGAAPRWRSSCPTRSSGTCLRRGRKERDGHIRKPDAGIQTARSLCFSNRANPCLACIPNCRQEKRAAIEAHRPGTLTFNCQTNKSEDQGGDELREGMGEGWQRAVGR